MGFGWTEITATINSSIMCFPPSRKKKMLTLGVFCFTLYAYFYMIVSDVYPHSNPLVSGWISRQDNFMVVGQIHQNDYTGKGRVRSVEKGGKAHHFSRLAWAHLIIVPDGPRGPNRKMKLGGLKLGQEASAYLVPFTFSTSRKKILSSWDNFLIFYPFSKVVAIYGKPFLVNPSLKEGKLENERQKIENFMRQLDERADRYFN